MIIWLGNYGNHTAIFLFSNQFTRFESDVFKPILEKIAKYGGHSSEYVRMDQSNVALTTKLAYS